MRMRSRLAPVLAALLLLPLGCRKEPSRPPDSAPAPTPSRPPKPWSWYPLGSIAVLEGEVDETVELVLKGRYILETRVVEPGPVRWEFYKPPRDEVAVLATRDGRPLATISFHASSTATRSAPQAPAAAPSRIQAPAPIPEPRPGDPRRPKAGIAVPEPDLEPAPVRIPPPARPAPVPKAAEPIRPPAAVPVPPAAPTPPSALPPPAPPSAPIEVPDSSVLESRWPGAGHAVNLLRGPRQGQRIALTFDGGSNAESAQQILDALKARKTRCTFFLTGHFIRQYPDLTLRMAREGHEIGNHTLTHPHLAPRGRRDPGWTRERFQKELLAADQLFFRLAGRPMSPLWRAPYGEHTAEIRRWAEELGYRHVGWSEGADTLDWATTRERRLYRPGEAILARLRTRMQQADGDGLLVLMHLGSERPEEDRPSRSLGPFMDRAAREGWKFVTVGDYVKDLGKPDWNAARRIALLDPHLPVHGGPGQP